MKKELVALRKLIAKQFSSHATAKRIADDAELDTSKIPAHPAVADYWHEIIQHAERTNLKALLDVIELEAGKDNHELLAALKNARAIPQNTNTIPETPQTKRPPITAIGIALVAIAVAIGGALLWPKPGPSTPEPQPIPPTGTPAAPVVPSSPNVTSTSSLPATTASTSSPVKQNLPGKPAPSASDSAQQKQRSGTATLHGQLWSLGVERSEIEAASFVCLDPSPRPEALLGVQPTCSLLGSAGIVTCSRSDKAREIPIGTSARWRLPCP